VTAQFTGKERGENRTPYPFVKRIIEKMRARHHGRKMSARHHGGKRVEESVRTAMPHSIRQGCSRKRQQSFPQTRLI